MIEGAQDNEISTIRTPARYRLLAKLGTGGMADVFLGIQQGERDFTRLTAVKRLHRTTLEDTEVDPVQLFIDEAHVVAALNHSHIVKVFDLIPNKGHVLISMEYVDGETLQYIIAQTAKRGAGIPLPVICHWMADAADALHYAHTAVSLQGTPLNLVHRDIDLRNIMVDHNGHLKIIDFGVAQTMMRKSATTGDQTFMGKISYAAPEIFTAPESVDRRIDIYALGLVFHALVTRKKPYSAKGCTSTTDLVRKVVHEPLPAPSSIDPDLPPELDALIARAVHKDPNQRFQSGESFAEAIELFARTHCGTATTQEIKRWYHSLFSNRIETRKRFMQQAIERAKQSISDYQLGDSESDRESLTPSLTFEPVVETPPAGDEASPTASARDQVPFVVRRKPFFRTAHAVVAGLFVAASLTVGVFYGNDLLNGSEDPAPMQGLNAPAPASGQGAKTGNMPNIEAQESSTAMPAESFAVAASNEMDFTDTEEVSPAPDTPSPVIRSYKPKRSKKSTAAAAENTSSVASTSPVQKRKDRLLTGYDENIGNTTGAVASAPNRSSKKKSDLHILESYE